MGENINIIIRNKFYLFFAIFMIIGILIGMWLHNNLILFLISICLIIPIFFYKSDYFFHICLGCLIVICGIFISFVRLKGIDQNLKFFNELHGDSISFSSVIHQTKKTEHGWRADSKILSIGHNKLKSGLHLYIYGKGDIPTVGDTLISKGKFGKLTGKRNPGDFDFRSHFSRQGNYGRIFIDKKHKTITLHGTLPLLKRFIHSSQNFVRSSLNKSTDPKTAGLLTALLLGDKSSIDENMKDDFANTGVIHVLAVSGLHVGYILIILSLFTSIIRIPWGWNRLFIIIGLIVFCALTGGKPSVIRASIMAGLYVLTPLLDRPANIWNIIGFSACFLLAFDPLYILDLGFILSYSAVISIIYFYKLFEELLPESINPKYIENVLLKNALSLFLVSLSAQIGTLPITAAYFHKIPIISLVANVIIVPIIGIIVVIGFMILGLSFSPFLSELAGNMAWFFQNLISWFAKFFSSFTYSSIQVPQITLLDVILYGLFILGLFCIFQSKYRGKGIITFLLISNLWVWSNSSIPITKIIFMDVGQGDAAIIQFSNGKTMLVDAGNRNRREDWGEKVVIPVLGHLGIQKLDWIVMSHPHADHIGGLVSVVESIQADTLLDTYTGYGSWTYNHLIDRFINLGTIIKTPDAGEIMQITPMESIHYFAPDSMFSVNQRNVNNASIVFKLVMGEKSILFTGDLEHEGDNALLKFGEYLDIDVLKVGHHGSITSTSEKVLLKMKPELAVVSVGDGNKFSHPSPVVMDRLAQNQITIHRTDHSGALWLESDGQSYWEKEWK